MTTDFKQGVFVNTVSVGGAAAKDLQKSLETKQKLLAAFGQLGVQTAKAMNDVLDSMANAAQQDAKLQASAFEWENKATMIGASAQLGLTGIFDGIGMRAGSKGSYQAEPFTKQADECNEIAASLGKESTLKLNVEEEDANSQPMNQPNLKAEQTDTTAQDTADKVLKSLNAKKGVTTIQQADKDLIEKISGYKTITENNQTKEVSAREYYKEQFEKKAEEYQERAQKVRDSASSEQSTYMNRANMYASSIGSIITSSINVSVTAQYKEEQQYTAAANSRSQQMGSMASSLQSSVTSSIQEATKEAEQQAQTVTQTQTTK